MSDFSWRKVKKSDIPLIEKLLKDAENNYVNACSKFILQEENEVNFWVLSDKKEIKALIVYWKNNILPVLCGHVILWTAFTKNFYRLKKSIQYRG